MRVYLLPDETLMTEECDDGLLVLNLGNERCTFFDDVGAEMWRALRETPDLEAAAEIVQPVFAVDRAMLRRDLEAFADSLVGQGWAAKEPWGERPVANSPDHATAGVEA